MNIIQLFHLAEDIPRCKAGDTVCLPGVITQIIQSNPHGHAGLSIPPLEPLHINRINIDQGAQNPVSVKLDFKDLDLSGMSKAVVTRVE